MSNYWDYENSAYDDEPEEKTPKEEYEYRCIMGLNEKKLREIIEKAESIYSENALAISQSKELTTLSLLKQKLNSINLDNAKNVIYVQTIMQNALHIALTSFNSNPAKFKHCLDEKLSSRERNDAHFPDDKDQVNITKTLIRLFDHSHIYMWTKEDIQKQIDKTINEQTKAKNIIAEHKKIFNQIQSIKSSQIINDLKTAETKAFDLAKGNLKNYEDDFKYFKMFNSDNIFMKEYDAFVEATTPDNSAINKENLFKFAKYRCTHKNTKTEYVEQNNTRNK